MHMHIARAAEQAIFEMVMFQLLRLCDMLASPDRKGFSQSSAPSR
jgi:hypothetical protein